MGTKRWLHDLFVHDTSVKQEIGRAATAAGYGLDPQQFARPFPGSTTTVTIAPLTPSQTTNAGKWLAAALLLALAGSGFGLWALAKPGVSLPLSSSGGIEGASQEIEIRWKVVDGKLVTEVVPVDKGKAP